MAQVKEELHGIVTVTFKAKVGDGILAKGRPVRITGDYEVGAISAAADFVVGYVLVPNKEDGGDVTIATRGRRVSTEEAAAAIAAGVFVNFNAFNTLTTPGGVVGVTNAGILLQAASAGGEFVDVLWF